MKERFTFLGERKEKPEKDYEKVCDENPFDKENGIKMSKDADGKSDKESN
jgi:hypothetical protein